MKKGFTIVEITLVFALFALIAGISLPLGFDAYRNYLLTSEARTLLSILRRAEFLALSNHYNSSHGVAVEESQFVLFQGSSYATRNAAYDEEYPRATALNVSSTGEFVFAPISGLPTPVSSTITLSNASKSQNITINEQGTIDW